MLLEAGERRRAIERRQLAQLYAVAQHKPGDIEKVLPWAKPPAGMEDVGAMADDGPVPGGFESGEWWDG